MEGPLWRGGGGMIDQFQLPSCHARGIFIHKTSLHQYQLPLFVDNLNHLGNTKKPLKGQALITKCSLEFAQITLETNNNDTSSDLLSLHDKQSFYTTNSRMDCTMNLKWIG